MKLNPQFLINKKGEKVAVQLSIKKYKLLIDELEIKEDILLYRNVKDDKMGKYIPLARYLKKQQRR